MTRNLKYYFTNNFGGGGTNVSRVYNYYKLIKNTNIGILLNYFYLETNFKKTPSFNTKELNLLKNHNGKLIEFLNNFGEQNIRNGQFSNSFNIINGDFNPKVFLDSGAGNLLKELGYTNISQRNSSEIINRVEFFFKENVKLFLNFANKHKVDIVVGLDYADKGTYKQKENHNNNYINAKKKLINDFSKQKKLIKETIKFIQSNNFFPKIFIPIHGKKTADYVYYFKNLLKLEKEENFKFDGFAIGGIGRTETIEICKILENLKKIDSSRDFHILGASGIKKIINLVYSGANSFDCHTPWRRASDGEASFLIPMLDKELNIIDNNESFGYKKLKLLSNNFNCDCYICLNYSLSKIKSLYKVKGEDNYFAKILLYFHWIHQYDRLLKKIKKLTNEIQLIDFIKKIPNTKLKKTILNDINKIKSYKSSI
jgi:tRNA-guanine family transglycosylase